MDSARPSRFTVVNSDSNNIYISKSLLNKLTQSKAQQQQPAPSEAESTTSEPNTVPSSAVRKSSADQSAHFISDAFAGGSPFGSLPKPSASSEHAHTMPASIDPEYIAKHAQFDSSTHLYALRGEYEHKLQQYQQVWRSRFEELDHLNEQLFKLNSDKFAKEVSRVDERFFKNHQTYEVPCKSSESRIINCYTLNAKKPLLCADEVKKFSECVEKTRLQILKR